MNSASVTPSMNSGQLDVPGAIDYLSALRAYRSSRSGTPRAVSNGLSPGGPGQGGPFRWRVHRILAGCLGGSGIEPRALAYFVPLCGRLMGYFPRAAGLGESLPIGVAQEWGDWWGRTIWQPISTRRTSSAPGWASLTAAFRGCPLSTHPRPLFRRTTTSLARSAPLLALYRESRHEVLWYGPDDFGGAIGHLGFFRKEYAAQWSEHLAWPETARMMSPRVNGSLTASSGGGTRI